MSSDFPSYTRPELIADGCVHAIGVIAGLSAAAILIAIALTHLSPGAAAAVVIYALGMLAVFCFSAAYNLTAARAAGCCSASTTPPSTSRSPPPTRPSRR